MRIATWNVERIKRKAHLDMLSAECERIGADILVLTETDKRLCPDFKYRHETPLMAAIQPSLYTPTENRVSVYTNYPCVRQHKTYDEASSLCVELETERGSLLVYGTIVGIYGNRHSSFAEELKRQAADISRLSRLGDGICICGDFNCSFSDSYYFTKLGQNIFLKTFAQNDIHLLTADAPECIDHIAITARLVGNSPVHIEEWNIDKKLSDHKGIMAELCENEVTHHEG